MFTTAAITSREKELHCSFIREQSVKAVPMHWHNEYEISYAEKNPFRVLIEGTEHEIAEGHAVMIRSEEKHFYFSGDGIIDTVTFMLPPEPAGLGERLSSMERFTSSWKQEDLALLRSVFGRMACASSSDDIVSLLRLKASALVILSLFADKDVNSVCQAGECDEDSKIAARLEVVLKHISENYDKPLTLPEAASIAGYVPTYFSRIFKECTGLTFYDYLTSYRLAMAEKILAEDTGNSIVEVAQASGFGSVKTFDRVFKTRKGISPLKYRKQCQNASKS